MRILHVHSGNVFGGVERMMQALAPATAPSVVQSTFALCFDGQTAETLRAAKADVHLLGSVRARRFDEVRSARRRLRQVLAEASPAVAVVHSAWSQAIFGPTVMKSKVPLVRWLHSPEAGPAWLEAWAARSKPALVLCNSRYTLENARGRFGAVPTAVQYPPLAIAAAASDARERVRSAVGTSRDDVVVMMAARLEAGKGHRHLLEALAGVRTLGWEAWIAGGAQQPADRPFLDELRRLADTLGVTQKVRFLGQRSDVAELLSAADLYCQPNVAADSFGLSFVEALAFGLPVVTTRLGGAIEIVDENCGVLVAPGSTDATTAALERLIEDVSCRQSMSAAARRRALAFCDVSGTIESLAAHLTRVVSHPLALTC